MHRTTDTPPATARRRTAGLQGPTGLLSGTGGHHSGGVRRSGATTVRRGH